MAHLSAALRMAVSDHHHQCGSLNVSNITPKLLLISGSTTPDTFIKVAEQAMLGGVDAILIREKEMDSAHLLAFSAKVRSLTHRFNTRLIIHSHAEIAKAIDADGVHLATTDMHELPAIRCWLASDHKTISASCHNRQELDQAAKLGADFALLSPVFPTETHPGAPSLGADSFLRLVEGTTLPVVALGGINRESCHKLSGFGLAVIRTITEADDPEAVARDLRACG